MGPRNTDPTMGEPEIIISKDEPNNNKAVDIDTALVLTEHRWFHWRLLLIGGFGFLATGFEFTLHAYILPFAECDLNIDAAQMGIINALFLGGSLISSLFWGIMADSAGRRSVLVGAMILEGLCTMVASWSSSFIMFAAIRACSGFLCGSGATVLLSYVGEFCSDKIRPRNICLLGFAWTMSWMLLPGLAALIIPLKFKLETNYITYKSWRLLVALVGVPNIIAGLSIYFFLPESPKFFFAKGEESRALSILRNMYTTNTGNPVEHYAVSRLYSGNPDIDNNSIASEKIKKSESVSRLCTNMFGQMRTVFCPPLLWSTMLSCSVYMCGMFGYYGLGLWLPTLFDRFEAYYVAHPNESVSVCQLSKVPDVLNATSEFTPSFLTCEDKTINLAIFTNTFIMGAGCFVGNFLATVLATKVQARLLATVFLSLAGCCVFAIYFLNSPTTIVSVSAVFMGAVNAGMSVHNISAINLFPTSIRGMGVCISFLFGRGSAVMGSLIFGMLIDVYCSIPIFLVGTIVLLGGGFSLLIPKSSQKAKE